MKELSDLWRCMKGCISNSNYSAANRQLEMYLLLSCNNTNVVKIYFPKQFIYRKDNANTNYAFYLFEKYFYKFINILVIDSV